MMRSFFAAVLVGTLSLWGCATSENPGQPDASGPSTDATIDLTADGSGPSTDTTVDLTVDSQGPTPDISVDSPILTEGGPTPDITVDSGGTVPDNDDCANAKPLTWAAPSVSVTGDNTNATNAHSLFDGDCTGYETEGQDLFYKITLPPGNYIIQLHRGTIEDPALYVLPMCAGECIVGADEEGEEDELVFLSVATSTEYIIVVDAYDIDPEYIGSFTLIISEGAVILDAGPDPDIAIIDDMGIDLPSPDAGVDLPQVDAPEADAPEVDAPEVDAPEVDAPEVDAPEVDAPETDAVEIDATQEDLATPTHGLVITEIMINPAAVDDKYGEWFEILNAGDTAVDLQGWKIEDDDPINPAVKDDHVILDSLVVAPGTRVVLGRSDERSDTQPDYNGNVPVDYCYGCIDMNDFQLGNSGDEIVLVNPDGVEVDRVEYPGSFVVGGESKSLIDPALDNNDMDNWCEEPDAWAVPAGDKGTPGAAPGCS